MQKAKKYDWKDSNMALFGSDTDKKVKKESAETEPAWANAGTEVGMQVWRINQFKVEHWPKESYGSFYNGDSYVLLNTYKKPDSDALEYDVHFWIGTYSTQDEYGTAAYKTVELDTLLDDKPIQHREVQGHESDLFKSYFPTLTYLKGGAESGFRKVKTEEAKPMLFHFHGERRNIEVREVPLNRGNLDPTDVYILVGSSCIYQWNGKGCNKDEKFKAVQHCQELKSRNGKLKSEVVEEGEEDKDFLGFFSESEEVEERFQKQDFGSGRKLFKLSDNSGEMSFSLLGENDSIERGMFDSDDVFIFDKPDQVYVWIGNGASPNEKKSWPVYVNTYLADTEYPCKPVTVVKEGREPEGFF